MFAIHLTLLLDSWKHRECRNVVSWMDSLKVACRGMLTRGYARHRLHPSKVTKTEWHRDG